MSQQNSAAATTSSNTPTYKVATVDSWLKLYYEDLPKYATDRPITPAELAAAFDRWHARTYKEWEATSQGTRYVTFDALLQNDAMLKQWYSTADGRAALITLCDGVGRFLYKGQAKAMALLDDTTRLVLELVQTGALREYSTAWQCELLMPCMHSEKKELQQIGIDEYVRLDAEPWITITRDHLAVLERFGRFPYLHDDDMTAEEQAWMQSDEIPLYLKLQGHVDSTYHLQVKQKDSAKQAAPTTSN